MSLDGLKLVSTIKRPAPDENTRRRMRLLMQIDKQIRLVESTKEGRTVRGRWWTTDTDGKLALAIKYGKVPLELSKGKFGIVCSSLDEVALALGKARSVTLAGTWDAQLAEVSSQIKSRFKK